jgi:anti-sigma-K factor RskA
MTEKNEYFDEDLDFRVPSKLSADLNALFKPKEGVPPEVDRAVMNRANKHFAALQSDKGRRLRVHWIWRIAAAAAVVIFAFSLDLTKQSRPAKNSLSTSKAQAVDIDRNGRVDILDAFKLARHIEANSPAEKSWDVNGDGSIDRSDVDIVAHAAVRLDKGV